MTKRDYLLIFSVTLNFIFILAFIGIFLNYSLREISKKDNSPRKTNIVENITSEVFGEKKEETEFKVSKVVDGDTIHLDSGETVRYIGIDTPELSKQKECFADESTEKNKELVLGKTVRLEKDISEADRYGRLLRYVYVVPPSQDATVRREVFVNEYLVREGYANAVTYPPDVKFADLFRQAENDARENNRGLWGKCDIN